MCEFNLNILKTHLYFNLTRYSTILLCTVDYQIFTVIFTVLRLFSVQSTVVLHVR